jgi:hypothetical protein
MAGSLGYSLKVANVYQRRFDSETLATALTGSHLYIISRRPAVRIDRSSVRVYAHQITFDVVTNKSIRSDPERHSLVLNFEHSLEVEDFRTYSNSTYFSFRANGFLIHGDAWALASLASNAGTALATQEVLYVGQAHGQDGSSNSWQRTRRHSTLQKIYEDHSGEDWSIFVSPLIVVKTERSSEDHIDDQQEPTVNILGMSADDAFYDSRRKIILPTSIDLIEHALITYFAPPYNELLKEWRPERPTVAMGKMKSAGFRLLQIHLDGWQGLARYYAAQTKQNRSHLVLLGTEADSREHDPRVSYDSSVDNWRLELLVMHYRELLDAAETSAAVLSIFGEEAPRVRRPPEVRLPDSESTWSLEEAREAYAVLREEVIEYEGPGFDPDTGLLPTSTYADGQRGHWRLVRPGQGVCHGVIAGARQTGKTNTLNILRTEVLCSGLFGPLMLIDPTGCHDFTAWRDHAYTVADTPESAIDLLSAVARAVVARREAGNYVLSASTPGILVTLENAHMIFATSRLATRKADVIARFGESVGVSLVVTVPDLNIARFGNRHSLRAALRRYNTVVFGPPDAYEMHNEGDDHEGRSAPTS